MAIERNETLVLEGVAYPFRTPKVAIVLSALLRSRGVTDQIERTQILLGAQADWLRSGVGDEAWADIERRLMDEEDTLDWPHISGAFEERMSADAARPTTSSAGSSVPSSATTPSAAEPSRVVSMFGS